MFNDLYDVISLAWSWRWPVANGVITAVDVERFRSSNGRYSARLAVAYEFSVGDDGPYTGESIVRQRQRLGGHEHSASTPDSPALIFLRTR